MSFTPITTHSVEEVADFLHKSVHSVYSDVSRKPESLPPILRVPGSSKLLFCNMYEWAAGLLENAVPVARVELIKKKKRGRPSHSSKGGAL